MEGGKGSIPALAAAAAAAAALAAAALAFSRLSRPFSEELESCEGQRSLELADSVERGRAVGKALQGDAEKGIFKLNHVILLENGAFKLV